MSDPRIFTHIAPLDFVGSDAFGSQPAFDDIGIRTAAPLPEQLKRRAGRADDP
jgi:hypothetical protein